MPYRKRLERRRDAHARAAAAHERAVLVHEQAADQARSVGDGPREARERGMVIAQREGALLERARGRGYRCTCGSRRGALACPTTLGEIGETP